MLGEWNVPKAVLSPQNIILVASVWVNARKIFSTRMSKNEVKKLMETRDGYDLIMPKDPTLPYYANPQYSKIINALKIELAKDRKQFTAELNETKNDSLTVDEKKRLEEARRPLSTSWPVCKIHCIRLDTHQICAIYDSSSSQLHLDGMPPRNLGYYETNPFHPSFPLLPTRLGHRYIGRLTNSKTGNVFKRCGMRFYARYMGYETFRINIGVGLPCPMKRNGVTMYHILEELEAWNH